MKRNACESYAICKLIGVAPTIKPIIQFRVKVIDVFMQSDFAIEYSDFFLSLSILTNYMLRICIDLTTFLSNSFFFHLKFMVFIKWKSLKAFFFNVSIQKDFFLSKILHLLIWTGCNRLPFRIFVSFLVI